MTPVYEDTEVTMEMLIDCLNESHSNPVAMSAKSPNDADPLTTESFIATLEALTEPFGEVLKDYYTLGHDTAIIPEAQKNKKDLQSLRGKIYTYV